MELKTDKSHKKIDLRHLDLSKAKKLGLDIGLTSLILVMLSGCGKKDDYEYKDNMEATTQEQVVEQPTSEDIVVEIEEPVVQKRTYNIVEHDDDELVDFDFEGVVLCGDEYKTIDTKNITYGDLKNVKDITINMTNIDDKSKTYDILNYVPNIETLWIYDNNYCDTNFNNVDGSRFTKDLKIVVDLDYNDEEDKFPNFTRDKYAFLSDIPSINKLELRTDGNCNYDSEFIQSLKQVEDLKFDLSFYSNFKYTDLTHLKSLRICGEPYDVPVYFSNDDIQKLKDSGVDFSINYHGNDYLNDVIEINNEIDSIVDSLNIDENMSEQEKLNTILTYILSNYEYDEEIAKYQDEGLEIPDELRNSFYSLGHLKAIFEKDSQICGNYAAITSALCKRVGLDSFNLISENHAWNAVKLGDYYYYVDSTWLDGEKTYLWVTTDYTEVDGQLLPSSMESHIIPTEEAFSEKNYEAISNLSWYLVDPTEVDEISTNQKESHDLSFTPYGLELKDIPEDVEDEVHYKNIVTEEGNEEMATEETGTEELTSDNVEDISNKKFHVNINGKTIIIGAGAFIGILSALGIGKLVKKKKEKRRRHWEIDDMLDEPLSKSSDDSWDFDDDVWNSSSKKGRLHW